MTAEEVKKIDCTVRDGLFVEPCDALSGAVDNMSPAFSRARGIAYWETFNRKTGKPGRSFFGVKSKAYPDGVAFNFCPFCGGKIRPYVSTAPSRRREP